MQKYRSSGRVPFGGLLLMVIGAVVIGAAFGAALYFAERVISFYLICIFPAAVALVGGGIFGWLVTTGKVRSPIIAMLFAIITALAVLGTYRGLTYYIGYPQDLREAAVAEGFDDLTDEEIKEFGDLILEETTGRTDIIGFLQMSAQDGIVLTYRSAEIELKDTTLWIYWGLEALAIIAVFAFMGASAAGNPFDESVNSWYSGTTETLGYVPWDNRKQVYDAVNAGDWRTASRLIAAEGVPMPYVSVNVTHSKPESQQHYLTFVETKRSGNNTNTSTALDGIIGEPELRSFKSLLQQNQGTA